MNTVALHRPAAPIKPAENATWPLADVLALFELPFPELMHRASTLHREYFPDGDVELATLLSIKTGGCEEDCGYCPQAARYDTGVEAKKILDIDTVLDAARAAKASGATRFCMGAAWRSPKERDMEKVETMVREVKALGMETCATLGMLEAGQAEQLKKAGLDYYNHNIDTAPDFYNNVISTREYQDRLDTLGRVREAGLKVCCGGIVGMGETVADRISMLVTLATLERHPESVPLNMWNEIEGAPVMDKARPADAIAFVRLVALARILMPQSVVRLSAGRDAMSDEMQAMCFLAGANSIFTGDVLLTTGNPGRDRDAALLARLGMRAARLPEPPAEPALTSCDGADPRSPGRCRPRRAG